VGGHDCWWEAWDPRPLGSLNPALLSSAIMTECSTGSPVHILMLSIQAVRGLPRLRSPGVVPCIISFSRQTPLFPHRVTIVLAAISGFWGVTWKCLLAPVCESVSVSHKVSWTIDKSQSSKIFQQEITLDLIHCKLYFGLTNHLSQLSLAILSLAIPPWVGAMSTGQRVVMAMWLKSKGRYGSCLMADKTVWTLV